VQAADEIVSLDRECKVVVWKILQIQDNDDVYLTYGGRVRSVFYVECDLCMM
jgi:hypothetical protein